MRDDALPINNNLDARRRVGVLVSERKPFSNTSGTFRGFPGMPGTFGDLPRRHEFDHSAYTIMSFWTPIAWLGDDGVWVMPDENYSRTTAKHQSFTRVALTGEEVVSA